jgi:hypothetical protein
MLALFTLAAVAEFSGDDSILSIQTDQTHAKSSKMLCFQELSKDNP